MTICGTGTQNALDIYSFIYLNKFILKLLLFAPSVLKHSTPFCFHMTSRRPYCCPKTMKRRPCWCPKVVLWELNSFVMQTLSFVPINLHRCWSREWKHSVYLCTSLCKQLFQRNFFIPLTRGLFCFETCQRIILATFTVIVVLVLYSSLLRRHSRWVLQ